MTADSSSTKFLFDRSFDSSFDGGAARAKPTVTLEQVQAAREEGYAEGFREGAQAASQGTAQRQTVLLAHLERSIARLLDDAIEACKRQESAVVDCVLAIARKILPDFISRQGSGEIEALIMQCLAERHGETRLVVRVHDSRLDELRLNVERLAEQAAYAGKLVLLADAALAETDCRIEWADGGIERDTGQIWNEMDKAAARALNDRASGTGLMVPTVTETSRNTTDVAV
ncbi:MAG: hypothetical protein IPI58_06715 [Alphaproteobacteria bacterium]|nr:MAG: hypothetical protein IPI58_06715 [Alphaproteobacteria bacterium]